MTIIDRNGQHTDSEEPSAPHRRPPRSLRRRPSRSAPAGRFEPGRVAESHHRNPAWLIAGVLLVVLSALGGVLLFTANDDRIEVVLAATDLAAGEPVERSDLRIARVALDADVARIDPDAAGDLIGQQPVGRIPAGTMLSRGMFADELSLGADEVVVGAALDPGEAPLSGLQVGSAVELLTINLGDPTAAPPAASPDQQAPAPATSEGIVATPIGTGTVWAVEPIATGQLWVSMRLDRDVGLRASLSSAQDSLRIVLVGGAG